MARIPPARTVRSTTSGTTYTVKVRSVPGGYAADVLRNRGLKAQTDTYPTAEEALTAGTSVANDS